MADRKLSASTELAAEPASGDLFPVLDISDTTDAATGTLKKMLWSTLKAIFAVTAKGVTNGDTHDHAGGDGAQIAHTGLSSIGTNTHAQIDTFIGTKAAASGLASLDAGSLVVQNPANATATPTASKIPIADASKNIDPAWMTQTIEIVLLDNLTALAVKDGVADFYFIVPDRWNGWDVKSVHAAVPGTYSSSATPTIQVYNVTDSVDILSTRITIDVSEYTSYTAAAAPVVDTTHDDLATGDRLRFDCDVSGTGTKGLTVIITVGKP